MKQHKKRERTLPVASLSFLGLLLGTYLTTPLLTPGSSARASVPPLRLSQTIKNWGIFNPSHSHIRAMDAWRIEEGSKQVVVAVIDTGVDSNHRDLSVNMWQDPHAKKGERVYGWNFVTNTPNPTDDHGHGTHVSGIIGAVADSQAGVSGVVHHVSLMAVKYYSDKNSGAVNLRNTVKAIDYAVTHGAKIINYSGGGPDFSEDEYLAIRRAEAAGVLFVAAAGNEHQNTDLVENYYYPAAYRLSNIISVAATDINNHMLKSSNWGKTHVDLAAPGENIFSTLPGNRYGYMSGTSQATAFVSGLAAMLLSKDPTLKPAELKELILGSVDRLPELQGRLATNGRVNAYSAMLALKGRLRNRLSTRLTRVPPRNIAEQHSFSPMDTQTQAN